MSTALEHGLSNLEDLGARHLWMHYSPPGSQGSSGDPLRFIVRGAGCTIWDAEGREYLDGISALEAMILGHGNARVIDAIHRQAKELAFLDVFRFTYPAQVELAAELAGIAPGMQSVYFTPGGAEAVEVAVKLAQQYHHLRGEPYRKKVITRLGAFHGATVGAMSVDGHYFASRNVIYDSDVNWGRVAPAPACQQCDFGKASRYLACVHNIEATIRAEGPDTVAAVIVDPAATAIAVAVPPDDYLRQLLAVCRRYGALLIVDEVITGMGRTGRLFCTEFSGVEPDFILMSKGLTSGYVPAGAALIAAHVVEEYRRNPDEGVFRHGHTYGGHPLGIAAARAVLDIVTEDRLWERAERLGDRLLNGLRSLSGHRHYWDARGRGLLTGLEIVADNERGDHFLDPVAAGNRLRILCRERGLISLILHPGNVLFIAPPLIISEAEVDRIVGIIDDALTEMERELDVAGP